MFCTMVVTTNESNSVARVSQSLIISFPDPASSRGTTHAQQANLAIMFPFKHMNKQCRV
jgi:hypothetical protein